MIRISFFCAVFCSWISFAQAELDFYWEGSYRVEGVYFDGLDLGNSSDTDKNYINHHIFLRPELILIDGVSFVVGLDVLNGTGSLPPSQRFGQFFGGTLTTAASDFESDVALPFLNRHIQRTREAQLTEAYLKYNHPGGELRIGRVPLDFGLGMTYSSGRNLFDHWYSNRDGLIYKLKLGPLSVSPMAFRLGDSLGLSGEDINEYGARIDFIRKDTGLQLSAMILLRHIPTAANIDPSLAANFGSAQPRMWNLFLKRSYKNFSYALEASIAEGTLGKTSTGQEVDHEGVGAVAELLWTPKKWEFGGKVGYASGNDPSDPNSFGGYGFHRNFNLGMMLFNHPMGDPSFDLFGTKPYGRQGSLSDAAFNPNSVADTDRISNAVFLNPRVKYKFDRIWSLEANFIGAWLAEDVVGSSGETVDDMIGTEINLTLEYKPIENINWKITLGYFQAGDAFKGPSGTFTSDESFGATSSFGITF